MPTSFIAFYSRRNSPLTDSRPGGAPVNPLQPGRALQAPGRHPSYQSRLAGDVLRYTSLNR